jgi:tetratricopeptide (TPR) repeat protein
VLFVLAGQNRAAWERIHPDWADPAWLEQHLINGLTEKDAREFLMRCGFESSAVQEAMLAACLTSEDGVYHTFHLGLLADLGWVEREVNRREVTATLFSTLPPGDWTALTLRFLKSLAHQSDADWLRKLAITPEFDEVAARAAYSSQPSQSQDTNWRMLQSLSFLVSLEGKQGWWTIHSAMQRAIIESLRLSELDRWRDIHLWWREYWQGRTSFSGDAAAPLTWYHDWNLGKEDALREWNELASSARLAVPADMAFHHRLLLWWQPIRLLEQRDWSELEARSAFSLGREYYKATLGDRGENLRKAISCYERALEVYTREAYPQDWAMTQNNLGVVWGDRPDGDRGENLRRAISCYEGALEVYTREAYPQDWARTQNNLGSAWGDRPDGDRGENLRKAISSYEGALEVRTREAYPQDWAMTQNNLGTAWQARPNGDRGENLRKAMSCYEGAPEVYTREAYPQDWARTQNNLGSAWGDRPDGDRGENLRRAISFHEGALEVYTREAYPQDWARTQNNLGDDWGFRPDGDRGENLRMSISCY